MNREQGGLFVELLLALALFAVCLVSIATLFVMGARKSVAASDLSISATLTAAKAEELKAQAFATLAGGSDAQTRRGVRFERSWSVAQDLPQPGMKMLSVTTIVRDARGLEMPGRSSRLRFFRDR